MVTAFELSTQRYLSALERGATIEGAIGEANLSQHKDQVLDAAFEMLAEDGVIDMKRLAAKAGISRASLYRYYPDKLAVEAEVAATLAARMTRATQHEDNIVDKLRVAIDVLIANPAGAASLGPIVAAAELDVISQSVEVIVGHRAATPVLIGFAAMVASAHRADELDAVRAIRDAVIEQFKLSYA